MEIILRNLANVIWNSLIYIVISITKAEWKQQQYQKVKICSPLYAEQNRTESINIVFASSFIYIYTFLITTSSENLFSFVFIQTSLDHKWSVTFFFHLLLIKVDYNIEDKCRVAIHLYLFYTLLSSIKWFQQFQRAHHDMNDTELMDTRCVLYVFLFSFLQPSQWKAFKWFVFAGGKWLFHYDNPSYYRQL